jgi:two-component system chemotaxis sensor kinase CheA
MGLARLGGLNSQAKPVTRPETELTPGAGTDAAAQRLLIFRAGSFERVAVPLALVDRLEEIETASIERAAGRNVLNYRGAILPLVTLQEMITPGYEQRDLPKGKTHVIVFSDGLRRLGLMVDCILDIVEEVITARHPGTAPGLLGSAILCGRITDLLDLPALLAVSSDHWLVPAPESRGHAKSEAAREVAA